MLPITNPYLSPITLFLASISNCVYCEKWCLIEVSSNRPPKWSNSIHYNTLFVYIFRNWLTFSLTAETAWRTVSERFHTATCNIRQGEYASREGEERCIHRTRSYQRLTIQEYNYDHYHYHALLQSLRKLRLWQLLPGNEDSHHSFSMVTSFRTTDTSKDFYIFSIYDSKAKLYMAIKVCWKYCICKCCVYWEGLICQKLYVAHKTLLGAILLPCFFWRFFIIIWSSINSLKFLWTWRSSRPVHSIISLWSWLMNKTELTWNLTRGSLIYKRFFLDSCFEQERTFQSNGVILSHTHTIFGKFKGTMPHSGPKIAYRCLTLETNKVSKVMHFNIYPKGNSLTLT